MSKRPAASASQNGRVQQRPRYLPPSSSQPELPEIPGVPPNVTPLLVTSLQSSTKFFSALFSPHNPFQEENDDNDSLTFSVVDSILSRMDSRQEQTALNKKRNTMTQDVQSWLNAVKRHASDSYKNSTSTVPLSCFRYLWELQQQHGRVSVRRAALHLCGWLLQKSSDCRIYLATTDDILLAYVKCVVEPKNLKASSKNVHCWQAEAWMWLKFLSEKFGDLYPKFRVARLFLEQRAPIDVNANILGEDNGNANMVDLRRIRDIALKYGNREIVKVDKLIQRAHGCLDVLVPRMGITTKAEVGETVAAAADAPSTTLATEPSVYGDNDDSDDDDIDWEDGDEEFDDSAAAVAESHADAVERTLATMAASAGGLQGGHIEINLETNQDEEDGSNTMDETTRRLLKKTVQSIESRHMKRLSSWVDALVKADGLELNEGNSLVVMSTEMAKQRSDLLHKLLERKQMLASILASASKLGVSVDSQQTTLQTIQPTSRATNVPPPRQHAVLATAARRRNDTKVARKRSTKLQIKYRTS